MIEIANDESTWYSLDEDDEDFEDPVFGVVLKFWCEDDQEAYVGYMNEEGDVFLFNLPDGDEKTVSHWADFDLYE